MAPPFFAEQMHPAMKIYAHGTMRKAGTSSDFRSSHAFDKTQD
jgi:hypothetical protein